MQSLILSVGGRALLHLHLLAVFFYFFGLPAIQRFLSKEVMNLMILTISEITSIAYPGDGGQDE